MEGFLKSSRPTKYRSYVSGSECHKLEGITSPLSSSSVNERALPNLFKPGSMEWHLNEEIKGFGGELYERKQNSSKCIHYRDKPKTEREKVKGEKKKTRDKRDRVK
ncbi:hypothetical protein Salat_2613000 [Sesamum alatum]|uniref:Uncharacterized protein n=1 Tax=Sesamum alatum TaxID=300844 RepID=A0AAE1XNF6_9LAMI|nr:hypothetical protein Salat_2613000 [Sesamum alatum]